MPGTKCCFLCWHGNVTGNSNGMDSTKAWEIIDELMDALKLTNERVYNGVMRRLHASKGY